MVQRLACSVQLEYEILLGGVELVVRAVLRELGGADHVLALLLKGDGHGVDGIAIHLVGVDGLTVLVLTDLHRQALEQAEGHGLEREVIGHLVHLDGVVGGAGVGDLGGIRIGLLGGDHIIGAGVLAVLDSVVQIRRVDDHAVAVGLEDVVFALNREAVEGEALDLAGGGALDHERLDEVLAIERILVSILGEHTKVEGPGIVREVGDVGLLYLDAAIGDGVLDVHLDSLALSRREVDLIAVPGDAADLYRVRDRVRIMLADLIGLEQIQLLVRQALEREGLGIAAVGDGQLLGLTELLRSRLILEEREVEGLGVALAAVVGLFDGQLVVADVRYPNADLGRLSDHGLRRTRDVLLDDLTACVDLVAHVVIAISEAVPRDVLLARPCDVLRDGAGEGDAEGVVRSELEVVIEYETDVADGGKVDSAVERLPLHEVLGIVIAIPVRRILVEDGRHVGGIVDALDDVGHGLIIQVDREVRALELYAERGVAVIAGDDAEIGHLKGQAVDDDERLDVLVGAVIVQVDGVIDILALCALDVVVIAPVALAVVVIIDAMLEVIALRLALAGLVVGALVVGGGLLVAALCIVGADGLVGGGGDAAVAVLGRGLELAVHELTGGDAGLVDGLADGQGRLIAVDLVLPLAVDLGNDVHDERLAGIELHAAKVEVDRTGLGGHDAVGELRPVPGLTGLGLLDLTDVHDRIGVHRGGLAGLIVVDRGIARPLLPIGELVVDLDACHRAVVLAGRLVGDNERPVRVNGQLLRIVAYDALACGLLGEAGSRLFLAGLEDEGAVAFVLRAGNDCVVLVAHEDLVGGGHCDFIFKGRDVQCIIYLAVRSDPAAQLGGDLRSLVAGELGEVGQHDMADLEIIVRSLDLDIRRLERLQLIAVHLDRHELEVHIAGRAGWEDPRIADRGVLILLLREPEHLTAAARDNAPLVIVGGQSVVIKDQLHAIRDGIGDGQIFGVELVDLGLVVYLERPLEDHALELCDGGVHIELAVGRLLRLDRLDCILDRAIHALLHIQNGLLYTILDGVTNGERSRVVRHDIDRVRAAVEGVIDHELIGEHDVAVLRHVEAQDVRRAAVPLTARERDRCGRTIRIRIEREDGVRDRLAVPKGVGRCRAARYGRAAVYEVHAARDGVFRRERGELIIEDELCDVILAGIGDADVLGHELTGYDRTIGTGAIVAGILVVIAGGVLDRLVDLGQTARVISRELGLAVERRLVAAAIALDVGILVHGEGEVEYLDGLGGRILGRLRTIRAGRRILGDLIDGGRERILDLEVEGHGERLIGTQSAPVAGDVSYRIVVPLAVLCCLLLSLRGAEGHAADGDAGEHEIVVIEAVVTELEVCVGEVRVIRAVVEVAERVGNVAARYGHGVVHRLGELALLEGELVLTNGDGRQLAAYFKGIGQRTGLARRVVLVLTLDGLSDVERVVAFGIRLQAKISKADLLKGIADGRVRREDVGRLAGVRDRQRVGQRLPGDVGDCTIRRLRDAVVRGRLLDIDRRCRHLGVVVCRAEVYGVAQRLERLGRGARCDLAGHGHELCRALRDPELLCIGVGDGLAVVLDRHALTNLCGVVLQPGREHIRQAELVGLIDQRKVAGIAHLHLEGDFLGVLQEALGIPIITLAGCDALRERDVSGRRYRRLVHRDIGRAVGQGRRRGAADAVDIGVQLIGDDAASCCGDRARVEDDLHALLGHLSLLVAALGRIGEGDIPRAAVCDVRRSAVDGDARGAAEGHAVRERDGIGHDHLLGKEHAGVLRRGRSCLQRVGDG